MSNKLLKESGDVIYGVDKFVNSVIAEYESTYRFIIRMRRNSMAVVRIIKRTPINKCL